MKVILRQDINNLGQMGEIVTVKDGYGRNYLIPRGYAYYASEGAMNRLQQEKKQYAKRVAQAKETAEKLAQELTEVQVSLQMKVGEEGRLFGSVTPQMIAEQLEEKGYKIDRRNIVIDEPIKTLGVFDAKVKLHPEVVVQLKVWVIGEE
jgi:large subunit ribosomal protein L9